MYKAFKIYLIILLFAGVSSCDIDDVKPQHELNDENVIRDAESAQKVLNGIYTMWKDFGMDDVPVMLGALGIEGFLASDTDGFNENDLRPEVTYLEELYNLHYQLINRANFLIEKLETEDVSFIEEEEVIRI